MLKYQEDIMSEQMDMQNGGHIFVLSCRTYTSPQQINKCQGGTLKSDFHCFLG